MKALCVAKSYPTFSDLLDCSMLGFPAFTNSWSLLKFMSIELVMLSHQLILCCPLLWPSIFPTIRVYSNELALHIRWSKYWTFSFSISPSNEYSVLVSFRIDWFDLLVSKGLSRVFSSTIIWKYQFFNTQSSLWSNFHIHTWYWVIGSIL